MPAGPADLEADYALNMRVRDFRGNKTKAINQELSQRRGWLFTIAVGFAVYILGFVVGAKPAGPLCGSPLLPHSQAAEEAASQLETSGAAAECYRNIAAASVPVWILMALGICLVLTGVAVRIVGIRRSINRARNSAEAAPK